MKWNCRTGWDYVQIGYRSSQHWQQSSQYLPQSSHDSIRYLSRLMHLPPLILYLISHSLDGRTYYSTFKNHVVTAAITSVVITNKVKPQRWIMAQTYIVFYVFNQILYGLAAISIFNNSEKRVQYDMLKFVVIIMTILSSWSLIVSPITNIASRSASLALAVLSLSLFLLSARETYYRPLYVVFSKDDRKDQEKLLQDGPFALLRHPYYSSYLLNYLAAAVGAYTMTNWLVLIFAAGMYNFAAIQEEKRLLQGPLRQEYMAYKQRTIGLIPYVSWRRSSEQDYIYLIITCVPIEHRSIVSSLVNVGIRDDFKRMLKARQVLAFVHTIVLTASSNHWFYNRGMLIIITLRYRNTKWP